MSKLETLRKVRMKKKGLKAVDILITQPDIDIPWEVYAVISDSKIQITFAGNQLSIGGGDYVELNEARDAIEWFVDQLGGKVRWDK